MVSPLARFATFQTTPLTVTLAAPVPVTFNERKAFGVAWVRQGQGRACQNCVGRFAGRHLYGEQTILALISEIKVDGLDPTRSIQKLPRESGSLPKQIVEALFSSPKLCQVVRMTEELKGRFLRSLRASGSQHPDRPGFRM